jgi:hypothetical protein
MPGQWFDVASLAFGYDEASGVFLPIARDPTRKALKVEDQHSQPLTSAQLAAAGLATQATLGDVLGQLDITLSVLRDAIKGGKSLADLWNTLQLQRELDESIWTDDTGAYFVRRVVIDESAGTFTVSWTDADGDASAGPGAGARPLSSPDREISQSLFTATAAGTGYAIGEILARALVIDVNATPPVVIAWHLPAGSGPHRPGTARRAGRGVRKPASIRAEVGPAAGRRAHPRAIPDRR